MKSECENCVILPRLPGHQSKSPVRGISYWHLLWMSCSLRSPCKSPRQSLRSHTLATAPPLIPGAFQLLREFEQNETAHNLTLFLLQHAHAGLGVKSGFSRVCPYHSDFEVKDEGTQMALTRLYCWALTTTFPSQVLGTLWGNRPRDLMMMDVC